MSKDNVSQELFMSVKERLDRYRLPCTFPIEVTPLLDKLLNLVSAKGGSIVSISGDMSQDEPVSAALKHQIARVVKQNNKMHMDVIVLKEQIQSLQHSLFKKDANRHCQDKQLQKYSRMKHNREQELVEELMDIKYKYNELMDFLHEDPRADRQYIKRLMKHKKVKVGQSNVDELKEVGRKGDHCENYSVKELQFKVRNRQNEIIRLQKLIQYDGINMNKLIKNFNEDMTKKRLNNADSKINYLQESYDKIKKENKKMRNNNGLKQALRAEVDKCHQIINKLKKQNEELRRDKDEQTFDLNKKYAENQRKIGKVKYQILNAEKRIQQKQSVEDALRSLRSLAKSL